VPSAFASRIKTEEQNHRNFDFSTVADLQRVMVIINPTVDSHFSRLVNDCGLTMTRYTMTAILILVVDI
jgi:hypothetical protein